MLREEAITPPIAQGVSLPILDELRSGISKDLLHLTAIQYNSISAKRCYPLGGAASPAWWPKAAYPGTGGGGW
jgi:hypothetical protein